MDGVAGFLSFMHFMSLRVNMVYELVGDAVFGLTWGSILA